MSLFTEWQDFVIFPQRPGVIHSRAERLNVTRAEDVPNAPTASTDFDPEYGFRVTREYLFRDPEEIFVVMEVSDYGGVMIWTNKNVWCLRNECGKIEKLIYLPRFPPES